MKLLFASLLLSSATTIAATDYSYQTLYYNQTLDHTQPFHPSNDRWSHRYLLNDDFWATPKDEDLTSSSDCPGEWLASLAVLELE